MATCMDIIEVKNDRYHRVIMEVMLRQRNLALTAALARFNVGDSV